MKWHVISYHKHLFLFSFFFFYGIFMKRILQTAPTGAFVPSHWLKTFIFEVPCDWKLLGGSVCSQPQLQPAAFFPPSPVAKKLPLCNDAEEKEDKQHKTSAGPTNRVPCLSPHRRSRYTSAADGLHWMCALSPSVHRGCATNWEHGSVSQPLKEDVLKWRNLIFPSRHPSSSVSVWIEIISL